MRNVGFAEEGNGHRRQYEEGDEEADATVGHSGASKDHRKDRAAGTQFRRHVARNGANRAAVVHQLPEQRAEQENREELCDEACRCFHEGLCPVGQQRLAGNARSHERGSWR